MLAAPKSVAEPELAARYREIRQQTEALCRPLAVDDYQVQSVLETSPPKWHLAHVTWFFETFLLKPYAQGYRPLNAQYEQLFNSYYQGVGPQHPRNARHVLSRPTVEDVYRYRAYVDEHMERLLDRTAGRRDIAERVELGFHHEQQHQELLLMDVKRNFFANPLYPAYQAPSSRPPASALPLSWIERAGGMGAIGTDDRGFSFDNERPRHRVFLEDFHIAARPVTNAEYLEFVEARGYAQPALWLSDGWTAVNERAWNAPLYWKHVDGVWHEMTLQGMRPLVADAPVCHVSFYEADAYARWREARLPSEVEWETAAACAELRGNFSDDGMYQPQPTNESGGWFGDVWEWTSSPYTPYPGYRALPGALGEYNGKFMANQYVLRGGCCLTPRDHIRLTYRNFFYPHDRWACSGIRLARDG